MLDIKKSILLVEDNPDDELLTLMALKDNNILNDLTIARDGEEALDYLFGMGKYRDRDLSILPTLILLDLNLPKVDGMEVLRLVRSHDNTKFLPVVILTSSKEEIDIVNSYNSVANSYIRKPVDFEQFSEAIRQLGLYWLLINEIPTKKIH